MATNVKVRDSAILFFGGKNLLRGKKPFLLCRAQKPTNGREKKPLCCSRTTLRKRKFKKVVRLLYYKILFQLTKRFKKLWKLRQEDLRKELPRRDCCARMDLRKELPRRDCCARSEEYWWMDLRKELPRRECCVSSYEVWMDLRKVQPGVIVAPLSTKIEWIYAEGYHRDIPPRSIILSMQTVYGHQSNFKSKSQNTFGGLNHKWGKKGGRRVSQWDIVGIDCKLTAQLGGKFLCSLPSVSFGSVRQCESIRHVFYAPNSLSVTSLFN